MIQYDNAKTSEDVAQFEVNNAEFISQDLLEIDDRREVSRRFPQIVAKLPNIPFSNGSPKKEPKASRRLFMRKVAVLSLVFSIGVGVGAIKPRGNGEKPTHALNSSSQASSEKRCDPQTNEIMNVQTSSPMRNETAFVASANFLSKDAEQIRNEDRDSFYSDLDSVAFGSDSFNAEASTTSQAYPTRNPFAVDFGTPSNAEKSNESPKFDVADFASRPSNVADQDYPTWDDLEIPANNTIADSANSNAVDAALPSNSFAEGDALRNSNQIVGQGFQDFQVYGQPNPTIGNEYLPERNNEAEAVRKDEYNGYSDKAKFIGYKTQAPQDFLANNVNYAEQDSRINYNPNLDRYDNSDGKTSGAAETNDRFNVANNYGTASGVSNDDWKDQEVDRFELPRANQDRANTEFVARSDLDVERQAIPANQNIPAPTPTRSLRW